MDTDDIKRLERVCLKSDLNLPGFGEKFQNVLAVPKMEYDNESEAEWLEIDVDGFNYNISRPYKVGTLQEWDDTTPEGCNFGIDISIHKDHPSVLDNTWVEDRVATVCKQLATAFNTTVYHHRSFIFGINKSERKRVVFNP